MKGIVLVSLLVFAMEGVAASQNGPTASAPTEGGKWLRWSEETRLGYVRAYVIGHQRGFYEACGVALSPDSNSTRPRGAAVDECRKKNPRFSKDLTAYVELITEYYHAYPNDLNVELSELLEGFSDPEHLNIEQAHKYYSRRAKKYQ